MHPAPTCPRVPTITGEHVLGLSSGALAFFREKVRCRLVSSYQGNQKAKKPQGLFSPGIFSNLDFVHSNMILQVVEKAILCKPAWKGEE